MSFKLTKPDYVKILQYYQQTIPFSHVAIKKKAEKILAVKLCSCIKKIEKLDPTDSRTTGICTKTVINRKGLIRKSIQCKNPKISIVKKTRKTIAIGRKKTLKRGSRR